MPVVDLHLQSGACLCGGPTSDAGPASPMWVSACERWTPRPGLAPASHNVALGSSTHMITGLSRVIRARSWYATSAAPARPAMTRSTRANSLGSNASHASSQAWFEYASASARNSPSSVLAVTIGKVRRSRHRGNHPTSHPRWIVPRTGRSDEPGAGSRQTCVIWPAVPPARLGGRRSVGRVYVDLPDPASSRT
jgi:hypothetical protein